MLEQTLTFRPISTGFRPSVNPLSTGGVKANAPVVLQDRLESSSSFGALDLMPKFRSHTVDISSAEAPVVRSTSSPVNSGPSAADILEQDQIRRLVQGSLGSYETNQGYIIAGMARG